MLEGMLDATLEEILGEMLTLGEMLEGMLLGKLLFSVDTTLDRNELDLSELESETLLEGKLESETLLEGSLLKEETKGETKRLGARDGALERKNEVGSKENPLA